MEMTSAEDWKFPDERELSVNNLRRRVKNGLPTYSTTEKSITCHGCGRTSYNGGDVSNRFCVCADMFHDDIKIALMETFP